MTEQNAHAPRANPMLAGIVTAAMKPYMVTDHGEGFQTWEQPGGDEVTMAVVGAVRALLILEAERAEERSKAVDPPMILTGYDWFAWGVRRALAVIEGEDRYDLASMPMDPKEPVT